MTDEELAAWVVDLITRKAPESDTLDYKQQLSVDSKDDRVELGKDVSSFANERGGVLLYGVPEVRVGDVSIPADLDKCGMPPISAKPIDLENILLDTVRPVLPELDIRLLVLPTGKPVLLIHHPRSWNLPHMIQGYEHGRYYRRGNYRAVIMGEQEVEAAYSARRATVLSTQTFFDKGALCKFPPTGYFFQITACPANTFPCRRIMETKEFREWLLHNNPGGRSGNWIPFLDGIRFVAYAKGALNGSLFELRIFHSGAVSLTIDSENLVKDRPLDLTYLEGFLNEYFFALSSRIFEKLHVYGPVVLQVKLRAYKTLMAVVKSAIWFADPEIGANALGQDEITFQEEASAGEMQSNMTAVINRVMDRLAGAFGLWRK